MTNASTLAALATNHAVGFNEMPRATFEEILEMWQHAKAQSQFWTSTERELRLRLFGGAVPTPKEGTNNVELKDGRICKFVYKLNRHVDQKGVATAIQKLGALGINETEKYLKPKYEIVLSNYKASVEDPKVRAVLDEVVTTSPGLPTLEVR